MTDPNRDNTSQENSFACRECKEYWSEESGASEGFLCEECENQLFASINEYLDGDYNIIEDTDDERLKKWILRQYKQQETQDSFIEYGHLDESYREFLLNTYEATSESFPETIQYELGEITLEEYNNSPNIRISKGYEN